MTTISADDSGPYMGIELNIWEQAKVHPFQLKYIYTYYVSFKFVYYHDIHYGVDFHCILYIQVVRRQTVHTLVGG